MNIPVKFEVDSKPVEGVLSLVSGAGSSSKYDLMIDGRFAGQLWHIQAHPGIDSPNGKIHGHAAGWKFASQRSGFIKDIGDYLGRVVEEAVQHG